MKPGTRAGWMAAVLGMLAAAAMAAAVPVPAGQEPTAAEGAEALKRAYRFEDGGWIYVHLEGTPWQVGYQHGYLLEPEIVDALRAVEIDSTYRTKRDWNFYRETARTILWPHVDAEYQKEMEGITEGVNARNTKAKPHDVFDIVALNAFEEVSDYYVPTLNAEEHRPNPPMAVAPGNCSAFVATGSWTRDHKIVMGHNNWTSYWSGERWRIIFDIVPEKGHRMLMDGFPGVITSDDDFGLNDAGIMVTETTITEFNGFDVNGKPEFERSRKAMQYAESIDDYARIMLDGNNGGYANDWLVGDNKTGEIAQLELGLKHHRLWRTKDGYFVGSNFPSDPQVMKEETTFNPKDMASSPNARHARWLELMAEYKGRIGAKEAEKFLSDHYDTVLKREVPTERTLCGHVDTRRHGIPEWAWAGFYPGGAVQGKVMDSRMAAAMSMRARIGHPCGQDFAAKPFLAAHKAYDWQAGILGDMKAGPWTTFRAGEKAAGK
ncbi:MAG TPA: C45 family peptidase [Candidatus Acidoferrales bacterium]|nr:C45 family peptidase [Candidatus Acidoferrales bacterium]